jgi:hypothetical protein
MQRYEPGLLLIKAKCNLLGDDFKEFVNIIEPLNIEARYPTHKQLLLKSLTENRCREILLKTRILQKWVKERL